jgi:hypothetical protein
VGNHIGTKAATLRGVRAPHESRKNYVRCMDGINSRDARHVHWQPGSLGSSIMGPLEKKDDDPTGEEEALEFDGSTTVQLDDTYRVRIASTSENEKVECDDLLRQPHTTDTGAFDFPAPVNDDLDRARKVPADVPTVIDKTDGYNPYDTIIEAGPPRGFSAKRNVRPR